MRLHISALTLAFAAVAAPIPASSPAPVAHGTRALSPAAAKWPGSHASVERALSSAAAPVAAHRLPDRGVQVQDSAVAPEAGFRVYLITVGQGDQVWEKFGHNAIWLFDERAEVNVAYNWGIFDFNSPGYYGRLMKGDMQYSMEAFNGAQMVNYYVASNRSVWAQELNLTDAEKFELKAFLENNALEENKYYRYDYYRDNCSTRVRDAIDRVTGGALRAQMQGQPTGTTFRWHTSRLTADVIPAYTGLLLSIGPAIDQPIDAWEESFLPVQLMEHVSSLTITDANGVTRPLVSSEREVFASTRPAERGVPPRRTVFYAIAGLAIGGLLLLLDRASRTRRIAAVLFFALALTWTLVTGIFGVIIAALWGLTDHLVTYRNENVLQASVLSLVLMVQLILVARGRAKRAAWKMAMAIAGLSAIGLLMTVLPMFPQSNGPIVALALPIHASLAAALWLRLHARPRPAPAPVEVPARTPTPAKKKKKRSG